MKKTIMIEVLLAFVFAVLLTVSIKMFAYIIELKHELSLYPDATMIYTTRITSTISYAIPALIAALADLAAIIIIAIKDLPIVKQRIDSFKAKRAAIVAEKTTFAKQQRIEKLQAELDELKKDE